MVALAIIQNPDFEFLLANQEVDQQTYQPKEKKNSHNLKVENFGGKVKDSKPERQHPQ